YDDVIVGAIYYDDTQTDEGKVYVYHGSASGLSSTPNWSFVSGQQEAYLGYAIAGAGDLNADNYDDIVVAAHSYDNGSSVNEGRAYVFYGSSSGLSTTPGWINGPGQSYAYYGSSVDGAGDVNGDGYDDLVVGAPNYNTGMSDNGKVYVYYGSSSGVPTTPSWTAITNQAASYFGISVAGAGDVNGDGKDDIIAGAQLYDNGETDEGAAFVFLGSSSGLQANPSTTLESNQSNSKFGWIVDGAGDVNGDGKDDVIVGASLFDGEVTDEGRAYLYYGSSTGTLNSPAWVGESGQTLSYFGHLVSGAGDVNSDGYDDILVGGYSFDHSFSNEGRVFVYMGSATGVTQTSAWSAMTSQLSANYGYSVASAGDTNNDGYDDVIIGAPLYDGGQADEGKAFLYLGHAGGLLSIPSWTAESNQEGAQFGISVAGAGKLNGDSYADIAIGSWLYDNGQSNEGAT
ncbi:hypothetical protein FDZ71_08995, partial [bacterium]